MATDDVLVSGSLLSADLDELLTGTGPGVTYAIGQVAELTLDMFDTGNTFSRSPLARDGTSLAAYGSSWEVGAHDIVMAAGGSAVTTRARSQLARRLRRDHKGAAKNTRSVDLVARLVKAAGGKLLAQPSQRKADVSAETDRTVLGLIDALAQDLGWNWCEYDGRFFFCDPHWAWTNPLVGLPQWPVTWGDDERTDALSLEGHPTADDPASLGNGSLTVPLAVGRRMRPLHTVDLRKVHPQLNGSWLITSVTANPRAAADVVSVELDRPRKGKPAQRTAAGKGAETTGRLADLQGDWIVNADKVIPPCTRSPRQYVAWATARDGQPFENNACLKWVSYAVSGVEGRGGRYAKYVWTNAPASAVKSPKDFSPPVGAIVVWNSPTGGGAGHVGISLGAGKFISATMGKVQTLNIRGYGTGGDASYFGAMTPHFWT